jgi:hypothetical protein
MESKLLTAFKEFVDDLKNVTEKSVNTNRSHDEIKSEFEKTKNVDISSLKIFDLQVGKIYQSSGNNSKQAIENHVSLLRRLASADDDQQQDLTMLPMASVLNSTNLEKIAALVSNHKQNSDSVVDVLRKVVMSNEFETVANDLTKNFSGIHK